MIEVLIVVAIITILATLLLPSLQKAKERGKQAACMSNLRQIYNGFAMYASDNDDKIPPVGAPSAVLYGTRGQSWHHWIGKSGYWGTQDNTRGLTYYVGPIAGIDNTRWKVLHCPGEPGAPDLYPSYPRLKGTAYYDSEFNATSYVMNWSVSRYWYYLGYCAYGTNPGCPYTGPCDPYPIRRGFSRGPDDGKPSEASLITDCPTMGLWGLAYFISIDIPSCYDPPGCYEGAYYYTFRHLGSANMLYMDGHVESVRPARETGLNLYKDLWRCDPP